MSNQEPGRTCYERAGVRVEVTERRDGLRPALLVTADLEPDADLDPWAALRVNARLERGALVVSGDRYLVRHVLALDGVTAAELDHTVDIVAAAVAAIQRELRAPPADPTCFAAYAD
jgi:hypothetical protein